MTSLFFALVIALAVFCWSFYTGFKAGDCRLHEFFIIFNFLLCVVMAVVSVAPVVQERQPNSGLLQVRLIKFKLIVDLASHSSQ